MSELVDAFAEALRAEPPPISEEEAAEAARRALAELEDEDLVDAFAEALAASAPPAEVAGTERATSAGASAREEALDRARRGWRLAAVAATLVLFVGVGLWAQALLGGEAPAGLVEHRLAAGHRIQATAGATLAIEDAPGQVRVRLREGEAAFDVARGSDFVVEAGDWTVRVTGTVFTVARDGDAVRVAVYEGSVEVDDGAAAVALTAGQVHGEAATDPRIVALARAAARRRLGAVAEAGSPGSSPGRLPGGAAEGPAEESEPHAPTGAGGRGSILGEEPAAAPVEPPGEATPASRPVASLEARARRALAARDYDAALRLADAALAVRPSSARHLIRGDALRGLGRTDDALAAYRRGASTGSAGDRATGGLEAARLLLANGRRAEARDALERSGALRDGSPVLLPARRLLARMERDPEGPE